MFFFFFLVFFFFLEKLAHGHFDILSSIHTYPTNYLYLYAPYAVYAIYDFYNQNGTDAERLRRGFAVPWNLRSEY